MASRAKVTLWTERALVAMILASLAGALFLTISVYRRALEAPAPTPSLPAPMIAANDPETRPEPEVEPDPPEPVVAEVPPAPAPPAPVEPPAPLEDPTVKAVAELEAATAREIAEAKRLDQRLRELEAAKRTAVAQSDKWRRRDMLVKRQIAEMNARADALDRETDQYAAERDVLARERDALKAAHAKADGRGSYAVLPYKGENGTWRRPIVMECANGTVTVKPNGPSFNMLDLSGLVNPRSSPVIVAIARELLKVQSSDSPDGAPVVPYFVFLVRPDGIRAYYEARARLEPLGIAFGYELIDQDLKVDVPDYDDLATWDGSPGSGLPAPSALAGRGFSGGGGGDGSGIGSGSGLGEEPGSGPDSGLTWPGAPEGSTTGRRGPGSAAEAIAGAFDAAGGRGNGRADGGDGDSPDDFVWSSAAGGQFRGADGPVGASPTGNADRPGGASLDGLGTGPGVETAQNRGLASTVDGLPDFEPAEDGPSPNSSARGGSTLAAPSNPGGGFGPRTEPGEPRTGGAGEGQGPGQGDEPGKGKAPAGSANFVGLEAPSATAPGARDAAPAPAANAPGEAGLMWGDGPSLAAGAMSETGSGTRTGSTGTKNIDNTSANAGGRFGSGSDAKQANGPDATGGAGSTSPPSSASDAAGSGGGPRPLITLGLEGEGEAKSGMSGSGPPPPGLGVGLSSLGDLAGLLDRGASGSGTGASGGGSGLMIGSDAGASANPNGDPSGSDDELEAALAKRRAGDMPMSVIDVPFDITVVCDADGLTIQPGGYRITPSALRDGRAEKLLVRHLASAVRRRAQVDPNIKPKPRVKFLVERDGGSTFWEARQQLLFADLNWPMSLQVAGGESPRLFDRETWR